MRQITVRLEPSQYLREGIEEMIHENDIKAGCLLSIVGGLESAKLRMAGSKPEAQIFKDWPGPFEIVSGTGTVSKSGCHIHVSLSDKDGHVIGGHLRTGCPIKYTAEIVLGIFDDVVYEREPDKKTGFRELKVT